MKVIWFHMQGYRDLPDNLRDRHESVWVSAPNDELCDPETAGKYLNWNLDELEYAAELGFDGIGTNEHHQGGYGFPVSPHMTAAVLARRTSHAAICLLGSTLPTYHPLRAAGELAVVDCMSGGRLVTGWPIGTSMDTVGNFGIPPTEVRSRYYEAHDLIKAAWTRPGPFPFNGKYTKLRHVNPWPKPIQRPHPPIWLLGGSGSMETYHFAAQNNYTFSYLSFYGHKMARALMQPFWLVAESYGLDDNPYRAGFAQLVCVADTDAEARRLYEKHVLNFYEKALYIAPHFTSVPGYMTKESLERKLKKTGSAVTFGTGDDRKRTWESLVEDQAAVIAGSPETVVQRLTELIKSLRIGHLITIMQLQSMEPELTKYSTRLFAERVLPKIRDIWKDSGYEDHWWPAGASPAPTGNGEA
ncbi:LLM class flavin-dependent oxidoreductase [Spirillospora sp. NBC_00431]